MDEKDKEEMKRLVAALRDWSNGEGCYDCRIGICHNLDQFLKIDNNNFGYYRELVLSKLPEFYASWKDYSGNPTFPIEGSLFEYIAYSNGESRWTPKRKDLARHIANKFEELLNE